jgi:hypothetical protein
MARSTESTKLVTEEVAVVELRFNLPQRGSVTANATIERNLKDSSDTILKNERIHVYLTTEQIMSLSAFELGYSQLKALIYSEFDKNEAQRVAAIAAQKAAAKAAEEAKLAEAKALIDAAKAAEAAELAEAQALIDAAAAEEPIV